MVIPFVIYLLVPSSFLIMAVGIYSYFKVRNNQSLIFLFLTICQSLFSVGSFFLWNNCDNGEAIMFWDRLLYIPGIIMPALIFHFSLDFCNLKEFHHRIALIAAYISMLILISISQTDYFVSGYFNYEWGCHTKAQVGSHFFLAYALIFVCWGIINLFNTLMKEKKGTQKRSQAFFVFLSFFFFSFLTLSILTAYEITTYPIFYLGLPAFALLMTYAITEKNIFVSVVAIDALTVAILILVSTFIIFPDTLTSMTIGAKIVMSLLFFSACVLLIKKNHDEIERQEEIERVSKMKSEFISISSHQLRTPLGAIRGYSSMIIEGDYGKISSKIKTPLIYINDASIRMIKLVNSLLDVSRLERGKLELKITNGLEISKIVEECVGDVKLLAKEKGLYIKYISDKRMPLISGDEEKLKEAIHNIINNAILYTQKGGITITIKNKKDNIFIQVQDTGIGIDKEDVSKIFKSFSRGNGASQMYTQGTGLGLFVARNFIEMHNGKLRATSEGEGRGSLFCIRLPAKGNIATKHAYSLSYEEKN